jgi:hypothetical protein
MKKTLTVTKWSLNDNAPATGFEYVVEYSPKNGVEKIVAVYAIERYCDKKIDVTMSLVNQYDLDHTIDKVTDWASKYDDLTEMIPA